METPDDTKTKTQNNMKISALNVLKISFDFLKFNVLYLIFMVSFNYLSIKVTNNDLALAICLIISQIIAYFIFKEKIGYILLLFAVVNSIIVLLTILIIHGLVTYDENTRGSFNQIVDFTKI